MPRTSFPTISAVVLSASVSTLPISGCGSVPDTAEGMQAKREEVVPEARRTLETMMSKDPSIEKAMSDAYGYAVFPTVASGAFILGGEGGDGVVFEGDTPWGLAKVAKGSIGAQIGGETYSELVIFKNREAFNTFTAGDFSFSAAATATAAKSGAAAAAPISNDMIVLVSTKGGLMASAAIGGQNFTCYPFDVD